VNPAQPRPEKLDPRDRLVIVGKTGSGKSTWAKKLMAAELEHGTRIVAFDPHDECSQLGRKSDQVRLGPLLQRCTVEELFHDPREWLDREDLALAVVPARTRRECAIDFLEVSEQIRSTGGLVYVVEEVGFFGDYANDSLEDVACQYRHEAIAVALVAQCTVQIPKIARRQASRVVSGRQDDPDDLAALEKMCGRGFSERVSRLSPGELVEWRDSFGKEASS
jgi:hypothetical protein